ncbi:MAG: hypothetical protein IKF71_04050 [Bacilli bacterium]|nr:hypothetical protein [Bacilli bacterium]
MKTLQEIEREYEKYPGKTKVINSLDDFLTFIEIGIDDTEEYQKDYEKELKANERARIRDKLVNFFNFIYNPDLDEIYDLDIHILKQCISYTKKIGKFYRRISALATEENYQELVRLVDFSSDYYLSQTGYYDYEREQLDLYVKGISLYDPQYENTRDEFLQFMEKKLKELEGEKENYDSYPLVKKKEAK